MASYATSRLGISYEQSNSITRQLMEDGKLFTKNGVTGYYLGTVIIETIFSRSTRETPKANAETCELILQEPYKFDDKKCLIFEERRKSKKNVYSVKTIYIIVDPVDVENIRKLNKVEQDKECYIMNFKSIVNYYSVKEFVSKLRQDQEGTISRCNSHFFEFPKTNFIVHEDSILPEASEGGYSKSNSTSFHEIIKRSISLREPEHISDAYELRDYNSVYNS